MKKNRFLLFPLILLAVLLVSAAAGEPDWDAIRKNQAWYYTSDGSVVAGKLNTIVHEWLKGEGAADSTTILTVYLCQDKTMKMTKIRRGDVARLEFKVDKKALPKAKKKVAQVSENEPGSGEPGLSAGSEQTKITAYVWLEDPEDNEMMDSPDDSTEILQEPDGENEADYQALTTPDNGNQPSPTPTPTIPSYHPNGGGFGGRATPHAKEKYQTDIGYDQVGIWTLTRGEIAPMSTLTLSGVELELSLTRDGQPSEFLPSLIGWQDPQNGPAEGFVPVNTLLLRALNGQDGAGVWTFNGGLLRKLQRSGISYLALEADGQAILLPTDGFLGGRKYDELKMHGTAGSSFSFEVRMNGTDTCLISVTVQEETTALTEDREAALHWNDIRFLSEAELNVPVSAEQENG